MISVFLKFISISFFSFDGIIWESCIQVAIVNQILKWYLNEIFPPNRPSAKVYSFFLIHFVFTTILLDKLLASIFSINQVDKGKKNSQRTYHCNKQLLGHLLWHADSFMSNSTALFLLIATQWLE